MSELKALVERISKLSWGKDRLEKHRLTLLFAKLAVFKFLGGCCVRCGNTDIRVLQIDHKNGGGSKHIRSVSGMTRYKRLALGQDDINKYQLLCANCNWIKRHENKEINQWPLL